MKQSEGFDPAGAAAFAWGQGVVALALMGSEAGGEATGYSDVDLVRFTREAIPLEPPDGSRYWQGRLVVFSSVLLEECEAWFTDPQKVVETIAGLRAARVLRDPAGVLARLQARAWALHWTEDLQQQANAWASREMVGWIEEVHKGLGGLETGDAGRLLNARFGLSWGLTRLMCVQRGILLTGDNALYPATRSALGRESAWSRLCARAFGAEGNATLREQVEAGLHLYVETGRLLEGVLRGEDAPLVRRAMALIRSSRELRGVL